MPLTRQMIVESFLYSINGLGFMNRRSSPAAAAGNEGF
jgi:hypothetical protein